MAKVRWAHYGILFNAFRLMTQRAHPALFAVTMGTGVIGSLFASFPYWRGSRPMLTLSLIFFFLNLFLFTFFLVLSISKYFFYPEKWRPLLRKPVISLYTGCFPMGATTLINVAVEVIHKKYGFGGRAFFYFLWGVWWWDIVVSFIICWIGVHIMITLQTHSMEAMSTTWLLPVVTLIVGSSSGGVIATAMQAYSAQHALETLSVSVFMVTVGLSLSLMMLTIYLQRLIIHGLPAGGTILTVFFPLGPTGQAGYSILLIGQNFNTLLPWPETPHNSPFLNANSAGPIIYIICTSIAFILWSLATMWLLYALLALYTRLRHSRIDFKMSFWGLVFPNGVYANLTIQFGDVFASRAFRIWGSIYALATLILWLSIFLRSLKELEIFFQQNRVSESDIHRPRIGELEHQHGSNSEETTSADTT